MKHLPPIAGLPLLGAFYIEFDNKIGPKLQAQYPDDKFTPELLEDVKDYVIPKPDCCGTLLTIEAHDLAIIGHPVQIQGQHYLRHNFFFNVGFLLEPSTDTQNITPLVAKLAQYFSTLETESGFLSAENKDEVRRVLEQVVRGINSEGSVAIPVNDANVIYLRISPAREDPPPVALYQVPVWLRDLESLYNKEWDLTLRQIIPYIDGHKYVKCIAIDADVDLAVVIECLQHLLYCGYIQMIDIFQYSNTYMITPEITRLASNRTLQRQCVEYVTLPGKQPPFTEVFKLYCEIRPSVRLNEFCNRTRVVGVDDRRLVTFGVVHGFLRRIHHYPVVARDTSKVAFAPARGLVESLDDRKIFEIMKWMDGAKCFDEICCEFSRSSDDLQRICEKVEIAGKKCKIPQACVVIAK